MTPGSTRLRQTKQSPLRICSGGKSRANCSVLPRPFCSVTTAVCGPTSGGSNFGNWSLAVVFEPDQHHVADTDFIRGLGAVRVDGEVAGGTADGHAILAHGVEVGAEQEMDFLPGVTEPGAVVAPHGPATDNGDFHGGNGFLRIRVWSFECDYQQRRRQDSGL